MLRQDEADALLQVAGLAADDDTPVGLRDLATLEVLYATGIRVGELCGLDLDDVDHARRVVRVLGKGAKERTVPVGVPGAAGRRPLARRRPAGARDADQRPCAVPRGARRAGWTRGRSAVPCTACSRTSRAPPTWVPTASGTPRPRTCWRGEPT